MVVVAGGGEKEAAEAANGNEDDAERPPPPKKAKLAAAAAAQQATKATNASEDGADDDDDDDDDSIRIQEVLLDRAWVHYRNYTDAEDDDGGEGEIDQLIELLEILSTTQHSSSDGATSSITTTRLDDLLAAARVAPTAGSSSSSTTTTTDHDHPKQQQQQQQQQLQRRHLVPVLVSVAHCALADHAISDYLSSSSSKAAAAATADQEETKTRIHRHLERSLRAFPDNAAAWSMAANYARMTTTQPRTTTTASSDNDNNSSHASNKQQLLASVYARAATKARAVRQRGIALLAQHDKNNNNAVKDDAKEWIEALLLNQVAGVELLDDKEVEEQEDGNDNDDDNDKKDDEWSASAVEGTARFMAAMLSSMAGDHDAAARQLRHPFAPQLTHRLHPHLWAAAATAAATKSGAEHSSRREERASSSDAGAEDGSKPLFFQSRSSGATGNGNGKDHTGGVLPEPLYERLCRVFHPEAPYWSESGYNHRGYYSYFMDLPPPSPPASHAAAPRNLIEDVVCTHLLPLAREQLEKQQQQQQQSASSLSSLNVVDKQTIVGYEWWVHTRPCAANLGHNLHFDTDEALLNQERDITHPVVSSVLYLTGGGAGGATVLLNQTPLSQGNAAMAWLARPVDNGFLTFPGNLLHGVLPCPGEQEGDGKSSGSNREPTETATNVATADDESMLQALLKLMRNADPSMTETSDDNLHRLTFMVGFWTRRVPDRMQEKKLYGPCGPLPPIEEATWVQAIHEGYPKKTAPDDRVKNIVSIDVPSVTPAWEEINNNNIECDDDDLNHQSSPTLLIPRAIDHRYFVSNAPACFRDSLFERDDEFDADEDEQDEEDEEAEDEN